MADSVIARGDASTPVAHYETGVVQKSFEMIYNRTSTAKYLDYITAQTNQMVSATGNVTRYNFTYFSLDPIRTGESLILAFEKTGEAKYKKVVDTFKAQLDAQPRTPEGAFWHRSTYPNQQWLDGIYMADNFYATYTAKYDPTNDTAWADIVKQYTLAEQHLRNNETGLLYHGYDASGTAKWAAAGTGHSPEVWNRALGWYAISLVDLLEWIPQANSGRTTILSYLERLAPALKNSADPSSGAWWLVMSQPGREGNYIESSGSAMFVYALLKGIRLGFLDKATYFPVAEKAYKYMVDKFVIEESDGTLGFEGTVAVGSLNGTGDYNYYISVAKRKNDPKGVGPFIMASVEYEQATGN
ncbi:Cell wall glycosyl hydrolase [Ceratobasidium theobromae]|uniref:Cell wall glycosyl hydrolase n=1 Tax=Ceratobasidium theobromae TaxID=1582974 RepID=A0A5N5QPF2_9AGAM|nr:Cell wall glycosyl hydrolase [Ceratobasidium theobromae]